MGINILDYRGQRCLEHAGPYPRTPLFIFAQRKDKKEIKIYTTQNSWQGLADAAIYKPARHQRRNHSRTLHFTLPDGTWLSLGILYTRYDLFTLIASSSSSIHDLPEQAMTAQEMNYSFFTYTRSILACLAATGITTAIATAIASYHIPSGR